jgi:hypothetical protein
MIGGLVAFIVFSVADIDDLQWAAVRAATPVQARSAYRALFAAANKVDLDRLRSGDDLRLATWAAWESRRRGDVEGFLDREHGFFAEIERRTGLKPPPQWEVALATYWRNEEWTKLVLTEVERKLVCSKAVGALKTIYSYLAGRPFVTKNKLGLWELSPDAVYQPGKVYADLALQIAPDIDVQVADKRVQFRQGPHTLVVDRGLLTKLRHDDNGSKPRRAMQCAIAMGSSRSYMAIYRDTEQSFYLGCIDTRSGELNWESMVWAAGATGPVGGGGFGFPCDSQWQRVLDEVGHSGLYVVANETSVGVFGFRFGRFMEVFDPKDGRPVVRFETDFYELAD